MGENSPRVFTRPRLESSKGPLHRLTHGIWGKVCVPLRDLHGAVAEDFLDDAERYALHRQPRRARMTEAVEVDVLGEFGSRTYRLNIFPR